MKFSNEKMILEKAYNEYLDLKKKNLWGIENIFKEKGYAFVHVLSFISQREKGGFYYVGKD